MKCFFWLRVLFSESHSPEHWLTELDKVPSTIVQEHDIPEYHLQAIVEATNVSKHLKKFVNLPLNKFTTGLEHDKGGEDWLFDFCAITKYVSYPGFV